jgi:hypothetical protein
MRVSIVIEVADSYCPPSPVLPDRRSMDYVGPLAPFIAQVAAAYLQVPAASALERRARAKAIADCQTSSRRSSGKFDRSV